MQKSIIKKQVEEKLAQLKSFLALKEAISPSSYEEVKEIQKKLAEASSILAVYEYVILQNQIDGNISVHIKILERTAAMELENKEEDSPRTDKQDLNNELAQNRQQEVVSDIPKTNVYVQPLEAAQQPHEPAKKVVQVSINDKYRIINELFHQSETEFNIAISQINNGQSIDDLMDYLTNLASLYNWKMENEIVKTFIKISQKRFL